MDSALAHVAQPSAPGRAVLVIHSWWGMTVSFADYADRLAREGFLVGCADLYAGRIATTADEVAALRSAPRREPLYRLLGRGIDELLLHPGHVEDSVAVVGFSMGGHWAVWLAQHDPRVSAAVLYYAARSPSAGGAAPTGTPVLAHFAGTDEYVSSFARRGMERAMARRGWSLEAHDYPGTRHWFAETADAAFAPEAAEVAFARTVDFLRR